ncbi:ligase-associated DNA damage response DEXH box helicase [Aquabacterium sp. J223]|uniref:ligase-associated DNA damage response DEXH box helicase n=1 Tax=Aquabacterium sp. J223 TaxID=2898431 RepID=UPI0021AD5BC2|nr:ligase-associated DNA damage response DEXH box helicase [Aquabacterium sp. J223]UUX97940.1 ligase-associated DNA damage response DEXH box helicase [Aquabacterium sp. J223]
MRPVPPLHPPSVAERWFGSRGWQPFGFQREVWTAMAAGRSGLLHATTGAGKTYAVWFGALARAEALGRAVEGGRTAAPIGVLWLTPMRALAADTTRALQAPLADLGSSWTVGLRTGDTPSAERARQDRRLPTALVTTPESASLLLGREGALAPLAGVHTVVVDEWHELVGSKRGVQVQLVLARLKRLNPALVVWGLSATLGNLDEAMHTLAGDAAPGGPTTLVRGRIDKALTIDTLLPDQPGRFTWGGHLGAQMQAPVVAELDGSATTLVFTNVRSQAEIWYQLLLEARPDWAGQIALHHGSLDGEVRAWVEQGLKAGRLKAVVATSSLDLGVDFLPVERVLQIGSPKGVARLLQRAGRSGHAPGRPSRITLVPTHTLELVEAAAARRAAELGRIERRASPAKPLDVLVQHLVTLGLGTGVPADPRPGGGGCGWTSDAVFDEVRLAPAYAALTREEFDWALDFVVQGGASLGAYPEYHRLTLCPPDEAAPADALSPLRARPGQPVLRVTDRGIAQRHRLGIGTIVSDATMPVKWLSGGTLGSIEEGFIARLSAGDCFVFAGRVLEYVRTRELTAYVRKPARATTGIVSVWNGSKMPLSSELADTVLELLAEADAGRFDSPELQAARPILETQRRLSRLPAPGRLLIERWRSREGHHLFVYPFAGRHAHLGLGHLLAWRLSRGQGNTFSISINDHGFELLSALPVDDAQLASGALFEDGERGLAHDVLESLNASALALKRFREIARVAGLLHPGYPGAPRSVRQLQASSSLFYEVFRKHDAGNLLLTQADREVLSQELELDRLAASLQRLRRWQRVVVDLPAPSPFALPLMVERFREQFSTEKLADRLQRLLDAAGKALGEPAEQAAAGPVQADAPPLPPRPRPPDGRRRRARR